MKIITAAGATIPEPRPQKQEVTIPYEEACNLYKHYKKLTTKQHINTADFAHNIKMREHYLTIKKKYDMRRRARKFRQNQKM